MVARIKSLIVILVLCATSASCVHAQGKIGGSGGAAGTGGIQTVTPPPITITSPSLPAGTVGSAYSQSLTAIWGTPPYSWTILLGSLPTGLSLNSSTGVISGTPTAAGSFTFSVAVFDSTTPTHLSATATFTIGINCPALQITSASPLPPGTLSTAYSFQFQSSGGLGAISWTGTNLPAGLTLSPGGLLAGIPSSAGESTVAISATDICTPNPQTFTSSFDLAINSAIIVQTISPLPVGTQGVAYNAQLAASGGTPPYTWTVATGSLPPGLTLSGAGVISGTPTTSGTFSFTAHVADTLLITNSAIFTVTIGCPTLSITSTATLPGATQNSPYSFQFGSSGGVTPITWQVQTGSALPSGVTLASNGLLSGTPALGGSFAFTVSALDSCSTVQTVSQGETLTIISTLTITTGSPLPTATEGQSYNVQVQASGGTPPYTWSVPSGTIASGAVDSLDYALMPLPDRNTFHLTAAPLSAGDAKYFRLDAGLIWWIKNSAGNPWDGEAYDGQYIKQWFTEGPTWGNASGYKRYITPVNLWARYHVPGADDVVYTPGPNKYNITENCGADNLPAIDNLGVRGELTGPFTDIAWTTTYGGSIPNGTPYLLAQKWIKCSSNNILNCTNEEDYWLVKGYGQVRWCGKHLSGGVYVTDQCSTNTTKSGGGAPTPNFACKVPAVPVTNNLPPGVPVASRPSMDMIDSTGVILGTPALAGNFTPQIQVEDSLGLIAQKSMAITVACPAFSITSTSPLPSGTQGSPYSIQLQTSGGINPITWAGSGSLPTGMTLSTAGLLSGTPTNFGSFLITAIATDACAGPGPNSRQQTFALTIAANSGPLTISTTGPLPNGTQGVPYATQLAVTGGTGPYTWAITVGHLPPGLVLNASTGVINGTPTDAEVDTPTFKVTDALTVNTIKVLSITTVCPTLTLVSTSPLPNGTQSSPYLFQFQASGGISPYTWTLTGGTFPTGLSLTSAGALSGTPSANGSFTPTVQVADVCTPTPQTASTSYSLTIAAAPIPVAITTTSPLTAGTAGKPYSITLAASGGTQPYFWSITSGALPTGLTLNGTTGVISGTPTTVQTTTPSIQVTDNLGATALQAFSITIACAPLTLVSTSPLPNGTQSSPYSFQFASSGGQGTVTWGATGVPSGLALSVPGLLSGTPSGSGVSSLSVTATDSCSTPQTANGSFSLTVAATPNPLTITTPSPLPLGTVGQAYSSQMSATGGTPPYGTWTVSVGALPTGLSLNSSTGVISGTPATAQTTTPSISVTDANPTTVTKAFSITIAALNTADNRYCTSLNTITGLAVDGPAQPLANCMYTARAGTPSPGATVTVTAGSFSDLQTKITAAVCGTTIVIPAKNGSVQAVYSGQLVIPATACSASQWITVRTDQILNLPAEGNRISPAFVGTTSLPGRPSFSQPAVAGIYMPKLIASVNNTIKPTAGASHWRFIGLEVTSTSGVTVFDLIPLSGTDNIILDQMLIHGGNSPTWQDTHDIARGVYVGSATANAVIDSYIGDIHCTAAGQGCDSNAIYIGGTGSTTDGPHKIVNNFLEAAGMSIFSGGGGVGMGTLPSTDVEIRRNHGWKPLFWKANDPSYFGTNFIIKNLLEFKNTNRALIEGNIFEQVWVGQSDQFATVVNLGSKNQAIVAFSTGNSDGAGNLTRTSGANFNSNVVSATCSVANHCKVAVNGAINATQFRAQTFTDINHISVSPFPLAATGASIVTCAPGASPTAVVSNITMRYNYLGHASRGTAVFAVQSDCGDFSLGDFNISIHDNVQDDLDGFAWSTSSGACCAWSSAYQVQNEFPSPNNLHDITISHTTSLPHLTSGSQGFGPSLGFGYQASTTGVIKNLRISDNISAAGFMNGNKGVCSSGGLSALATMQCFDLFSGVAQNSFCFDHNVLATTTLTTSGKTNNNPPYPAAGQSPNCPFATNGNPLPTGYPAIQFTNLNNASNGNYQLLVASPYHNTASDGTDPGANIVLVNQAIFGVQ